MDKGYQYLTWLLHFFPSRTFQLATWQSCTRCSYIELIEWSRRQTAGSFVNSKYPWIESTCPILHHCTDSIVYAEFDGIHTLNKMNKSANLCALKISQLQHRKQVAVESAPPRDSCAHFHSASSAGDACTTCQPKSSQVCQMVSRSQAVLGIPNSKVMCASIVTDSCRMMNYALPSPCSQRGNMWQPCILLPSLGHLGLGPAPRLHQEMGSQGVEPGKSNPMFCFGHFVEDRKNGYSIYLYLYKSICT